MNSYELDTYFPLEGTCFQCGRDLRHKLFDKINERFTTGESINAIAASFQVPPRAIEMVLKNNSVKPLGLTFKPTPMARVATA